MKYVKIPEITDPNVPFYLSVEEWVARNLPADEYFFAWQVSPSVICGRHQDIPAEVSLCYAKSHGINVWRRKSGGGAVYADSNNVMFSYITPETGVENSFGGYTSRICDMLSGLGISASPTGRNDIAINGRKVAGNAFYGLPQRSIVHGTMLYDADPATMSQVLTPDKAKVESKGVKSVSSRVTTLRAEGIGISCRDFINHAVQSLCGNDFVELKERALDEVFEIRETYLDKDFLRLTDNFQKRSFSSYIDGVGLLSFSCQIDSRNRINKPSLQGDYFQLADIDSEILDRIYGKTMNEVGELLDSIDVSRIITGLTSQQLKNFLTQNIQ